MEEFNISLAGVPLRIRCRFEENREFLADYITDLEPLFTVEPVEEDLSRIQADFDRTDEAEGHPKRRRPDGYLENNAIHSLLAEKLTEYDVLLMHGSALCMDGEAFIFTAKSGTGKSTHSRLWREVFGERVQMINDDKPMLRFTEEGVRVCGTPWDGKHRLSSNTSAPLKAVVSLERSEINRVSPMCGADAFPVLMKQCFSSKDPVIMMRIMNMEKRLLDTVGLYRLGCNTEPSAAVTAYEGLVGSYGADHHCGGNTF